MKQNEKYTYLILSVVALCVILVMNYIKGNFIDFDETFSLAMIKHSFADMWLITSRDFHPPLSYYILKVFSWIIDPITSNPVFYRVSSIVGYLCSILLCIFPIRRLFGFRVSVIAILLFIFLPNSFFMYSNIRMYAWTMPVVLATFVYAYDSLKHNSRQAWSKLLIFSLMAMYLHYYSLISTFVVFILLFVAICTAERSNRNQFFRNYLLCGILLVLLYAPWLYFFLGQLAEVKNDYWIGYPTLSDIAFAIQFYFVPKNYTETYNTLMSNTWVLVIIPMLLFSSIGVALLACRHIKEVRYKTLISVSLASLAVLLFSLALVFIYTYAASPVYHIRYLMCYFGLFVLAMSIWLSILFEDNKKMGRIIVFLFLGFVIIDFSICLSLNAVRGRLFFPEERHEADLALSKITQEVDVFYTDEDSFANMGYFSVLHPEYTFKLVTDDNSQTRVMQAPHVLNDTITTAPFSNISKVHELGEEQIFIYLSQKNPQNDSAFIRKYQVVDSLYSGFYRVESIAR